MTKTIAQLKENIYRLYQDMCDEGVFVEEEAPSTQAMMKLVQQAAREYLDYQDSCPRKWSDDEKCVLTYVKNVICALYTDSVSLENEEDENEEEEWNLTPAQYLKELKEQKNILQTWVTMSLYQTLHTQLSRLLSKTKHV